MGPVNFRFGRSEARIFQRNVGLANGIGFPTAPENQSKGAMLSLNPAEVKFTERDLATKGEDLRRFGRSAVTMLSIGLFNCGNLMKMGDRL